jgi:hypothetical protein
MPNGDSLPQGAEVFNSRLCRAGGLPSSRNPDGAQFRDKTAARVTKWTRLAKAREIYAVLTGRKRLAPAGVARR